MNLKPVDSSQIAAIGHDPETNKMHVQFKNKDGPGATYEYQNVSPEQFAAFDSAESKGKHFGANFKQNNDHPFTRLPDEQSQEQQAAA